MILKRRWKEVSSFSISYRKMKFDTLTFFLTLLLNLSDLLSVTAVNKLTFFVCNNPCHLWKKQIRVQALQQQQQQQQGHLHQQLHCSRNRIFSKKSKAVPITKLFSSLSRCSVELIDPESGCEVVLVGCFHGSWSSAEDVEAALTCKHTDVVVLELCPDRLEDLRKGSQRAQGTDNRKGVLSQGIQKSESQTPLNAPWVSRYGKMVYDTFQRKGLSTAVAIAVLGCVSGMQTALSGLQPGLEFTTALRIAASSTTPSTTPSTSLSTAASPLSNYTPKIKKNASHGSFMDDNSNDDIASDPATTMMDVVLADQNVDVTIYKMGQIPQIAFQMWSDLLSLSNDNRNDFRDRWSTTFGLEARALKTALFGSNPKFRDVQLPSFLTRSDAAVRDLLRLTVPPLVIIQTLSAFIGNFISYTLPTLLVVLAPSNVENNSQQSLELTSNNIIMTSSSTIADASASLASIPVPSLDDSIMMFAVNALFLIFTFMSVTLPAARVILRERDDQLTDGIRTACQLALDKQRKHVPSSLKESTPDEAATRPGRVVAVLGLLHVNGIAERLRQGISFESSSSESLFTDVKNLEETEKAQQNVKG